MADTNDDVPPLTTSSSARTDAASLMTFKCNTVEKKEDEKTIFEDLFFVHQIVKLFEILNAGEDRNKGFFIGPPSCHYQLMKYEEKCFLKFTEEQLMNNYWVFSQIRRAILPFCHNIVSPLKPRIEQILTANRLARMKYGCYISREKKDEKLFYYVFHIYFCIILP